MNHEPTGNDQEFNAVISGGFGMNSQPEFVDPTPYGNYAQPVKPGLTKRGKTALAIGAVIIAGGGLLSWQHYSAEAAASEAKTQEFQIQKAQIDLEMLKEMNRANAANSKAQNTADSERQKQVTACVNTDKSLVGKQMGVTYSSVLKDCQARFPATTDGSDMQTTASSRDAGSGGGGVNTGLVVGGAALVGGVLLVARRRTSVSNAQ